MGFDLAELLRELDALPFSLRLLGSDVVQMVYGLGYHLFEFRILKHKLETLRAGRPIYIHI